MAVPNKELPRFRNFDGAALLPPLSASSLALLHGACEICRKEAVDVLGSEHLCQALLDVDSRATRYIQQELHSQRPELSWNEFTDWCRAFIKASVRATKTALASHEALALSDTMIRILTIAGTIGSGPVMDGSRDVGPLVASEFLLIAALLEGTGVLNLALNLSVGHKGPVDVGLLCQRCNVNLTALRAKLFPANSTDVVSADVGVVPAGASVSTVLERANFAKCPGSLSPLPCAANADEARGPTASSNWIIPGRVLISQFPEEGDVSTLIVETAVTTIVCLVPQNELGAGPLFSRYYPSRIPLPGCRFVWFPIPDFGIPDTVKDPAVAVATLVRDLSARVRSGEVVLIHCLGGKGRTGLVVVALVADLLHVDLSCAATAVQRCTHMGRATLRWCSRPPMMPESDSQVALLSLVLKELTVRKR